MTPLTPQKPQPPRPAPRPTPPDRPPGRPQGPRPGGPGMARWPLAERANDLPEGARSVTLLDMIGPDLSSS